MVGLSKDFGLGEQREFMQPYFSTIFRLPQKFPRTEDRHLRVKSKVQQVVVVANEGVHLARYRSGQYLGVFGIGGNLDAHGPCVALDDFRRLDEALQGFSILGLPRRSLDDELVLSPQSRAAHRMQCFAFEAGFHYPATGRTFVPRGGDQDIGI